MMALGAASAQTSLTQEQSNNSSACSSSSDAAGNRSYCFNYFNGFHTNANNVGSQTLVPDSPAGHVSNVSIKQLMYPGWNGRVICEYQPWFGSSNHKSVGYNENNSATVAAQNSFMLAVGCDINLIDFYGSLDPNQSFNLATTNAVFSDLSARAGYPLKFGVMEDKGALISSCPTSNQIEGGTVICLENALIADMDYIHQNYASSGVYFADAGNPVIFTFIPQSGWPVLTSSDWDRIWTAVKAHTDTYSTPFKYIFEFGSFTSAPYDNGRYAWMQPPAYGSTQQFWWGSATSISPTYLDTLYSAGLAHPSQLTVGGLWKGFDDNNASWSGNRVIAQRCGQLLLDTANEIAKYFGGSNPQLPYVQVATWNDYEEGTEVETGSDNCYTVNASIAGSRLSWSLVASNSFASPATVHHFNIYYVDSAGHLYTAASNLAATTNTLNLFSIVPAGKWTVYVEMVGQPLIINRMSNGVKFNNASTKLSPTSLSFNVQDVGTSSTGQTITFSNTSSISLAIAGVSTSGNFAETNNCPPSLAPSASCAITVSFTPASAGPQNGSVAINSALGTGTVPLSGAGADFTIAGTPGSQSIAAGASATYSISVSSVGATFSDAVGFSCSGLPTNATCAFSPTSLNAGSSSTLTINTKGTQSTALGSASSPRVYAAWLPLGGFGFLGLVFAAGSLSQKRRMKHVPTMLLLGLMLSGLFACGGTANTNTAAASLARTYNVTVVGSSGKLSHGANLLLTIK
jgi:hypothetical protein